MFGWASGGGWCDGTGEPETSLRARGWRIPSWAPSISAPKHVQQCQKEGHLRWDSLGESIALATQSDDPELAERFAPLDSALSGREEQIPAELNGAPGPPQDVGGDSCPIPRAPPRPCARAPL